MNKQTIKTLFLIFALAALSTFSLTCAGGGKSVSSTGGKGGSEVDEINAQDSDGDFIPDYEEELWGTDPEDPNDFPMEAEQPSDVDDPALPNLDDTFADDLNTPNGQDLLDYLQLLATGTSTIAGVAGLIPGKVDICFEPDSPGNAMNGDEIELQGGPFTGAQGSTLTFKGKKFSFTSAEAGLPGSGTFYILGQNIAMVRDPFPGCIEVFSLKIISETCICHEEPPNCPDIYAPPKTSGYITSFNLSGTNIKSLQKYSDSFTRVPTVPCTLCESTSSRVPKTEGKCSE